MANWLKLNRRWWPVALLFALGVGLRLFHLGSQSLFSDEAISWSASRLTPGEMMVLSEYDHHAPLYYYLLKLALHVLPSTEAGLRGISVVASAVALFAVLVFLNSEWGRASAIYCGILMALSSFDLYYAQETRMYTLLAAAWIIGYIALIKALQGKPRWLFVWVIASVVMPWTHMYGFLVIGANAVFVLGYLVLKRFLRFASPLNDRLLLLALLVVGMAILPMARLLLLHANTNSVAGKVPQLKDLVDLYLLWTVGLVASRQYFVDGAHLILPATQAVSAALWFLAGTVICGAPAVYGLTRAWRLRGSPRIQASLALVNILFPVAFAFGYSNLMGTRIWIQRPFLGGAYLLYLWAGIGLAALKWRRARWVLAAFAAVIAFASLLPYFTTWQKSDARQALMSMPAPDEHNAVVLDQRFSASLARFYLGADVPMMAIEASDQGMPRVIAPLFQADHPFIKVMGRPQVVNCDDFATITDLWLYGNPGSIRRALPQLPGCVTEKRLWLFEQGRWAQLDPVRRDLIDSSGWLQFDDIRHSDWTTESYRDLNPGSDIRVVLKRANTGRKQLTLRYFDAPAKILEVWAAGQRIGHLGNGQNGSGWTDATMDLPPTAEDTMEILIKSIGTGGAGVARVGVKAIPQ